MLISLFVRLNVIEAHLKLGLVSIIENSIKNGFVMVKVT